MQSYYEQTHANVHRSIHTLGEEATEVYEAARDAVRVFMGARVREEVIFTRGTTDGINIVARALALTLEPGDEILVTEMEHHSNLIPWQMICRERGAVVKAVPSGPREVPLRYSRRGIRLSAMATERIGVLPMLR